jgi:hypothetical protein
VVAAYDINGTEPLPVIVHEVSPLAEGADALNTKFVASLGFAFFTIVRNPEFGVKTQSDGSEFGWPDG